jgi:predicted nuclease with TOPRIM domain
MNRTVRTSAAVLLQWQQHKREHQALNGRLDELTEQQRRLTTLIDERRDAYNETASQAARELIRREIQRLEAQNAELGAQYGDVLAQISDLRSRVDTFDGRLTVVETRTTTLRGDVDGLQARTDSLYNHVETHATAIGELQGRLDSAWWQPVLAGAGAFVITYVLLAAFGRHPLWREMVLSGVAGLAIAGLVAGFVGGGVFHGVTRTSASSSAGAGRVTVTPTTVQPVVTPDAVIPPPAQRSPVQAPTAAAAADAVVN